MNVQCENNCDKNQTCMNNDVIMISKIRQLLKDMNGSDDKPGREIAFQYLYNFIQKNVASIIDDD